MLLLVTALAPGQILAAGETVTGTEFLVRAASADCTPGPNKDLTGCIYNGQNLPYTDFSGADLSGATMNGATLTGSIFTNANLTTATMVGADLINSNFDGANFDAATLDGATFLGSTFAGTTFTSATTWSATTICPDGTSADISGPNCTSIQLPTATPTETETSTPSPTATETTVPTAAPTATEPPTPAPTETATAMPTESPTIEPTATHTSTTVPTSIVAASSTSTATATLKSCTPAPNADLSSCEYTGQDIRGSNFSGSDLTGAIFIGTDASESDFGDTTLNDAVLTEANLSMSSFIEASLVATTVEANLFGSTFADADLTDTNWGATTICPDGTISGTIQNTCVGHLEPLLSITNPPETDVVFEGRSVTGATQTTTAELDVFSISDPRGTGAGWHVTAQASTFNSAGGNGLVAGSLSMSEPTVSANGTTSPLPTVAEGPYVIDDGAVSIASAAMNEGMGIYDVSVTMLTLTLPADVYAGTYHSTVTISVVTGP